MKNRAAGCTIDAGVDIKTLGKPDRELSFEVKDWEEESGATPEEEWTSRPVTRTERHAVYDRGFVVVDGKTLRVFVGPKRTFDNVEAPRAVPAGTCTLTIHGHAVDPSIDLRPKDIDYRTQKFSLFGMEWGPTSIAMVIDGFFSVGGSRPIQIYLDAPATGRASYVEIH